MPEVQEVFRMATQKVRPDPGALERQHGQQRRRTIRRKVGVYGLVAALVGVIAVVAVLAGGRSEQVPIDQPTRATAPPGTEPVGIVTFDGSTCSMEMTSDRIEPGTVLFEAVNTSDQRVMLDSWQLLDGYSFGAFEAAVEEVGRLAEADEPYPAQGGPFPDQETEVRYLRSDIVPANGSKIITVTLAPGPHAIACLRRFEGAHRWLEDLQPFGLVGPIVVR